MFSSDENANIMFILMNYGYALFRKKIKHSPVYANIKLDIEQL